MGRQRIQNIFRNRGLLTKLVLTNILVVFLPLTVMGLLTFRNISNSMEEQIGDFQNQFNIQVTNNMDTYMNELEILSLIVYQFPDVLKYLESPREKGVPPTYEERTTLGNFVSRLFINGRIDVIGASVFGTKGASFAALPESPFGVAEVPPFVATWLEEADRMKGKPIFIPTHEVTSRTGSKFKVFSVARQISSFRTKQPIGYVVLDIDIDVIDRMLSRVTFGAQKQMIVVDKAGNIILQKGTGVKLSQLPQDYTRGRVEKLDVNGIEWLIAYHTSPVSGWTTISLIPIRELLSDTYETRNFMITIGLISFTVAILLSVIIAMKITRPVRQMRRLMTKVQHGDLNVMFPIESKDEIGQLGRSFNLMVAKLNDLGFKLFETEIREKNAQIAALQSKINPHFLYNTLGSISMYAMVQGNEEVFKMTNNLAKLLRYSLNSPGRNVAVQQEIEHVTGYLEIQKIRYEDRLSYQIDVEERMLSLKMPPLALQPIVENAINHGIDKGTGKGTIFVTGRIEQDKLVFSITDNGIGMGEGELAAVRERLLKQFESDGSRGNGLTNVHRRIVLQHGESYGLSIESIWGEGTTVTMTLPYESD